MTPSSRRGFSIRIFLADGLPDGVRIVEKTNWTGKAVVCPRSRFARCTTRWGRGSPLRWTPRARVDSSPTIAGGRVFVGSSDGKLYVLDLQSGAKRWEYEVGNALTASPAIAGGRLVIGAQDGRIYCFG